MLEFFATNAPDPPPFNSKHMFWCILYCLRVFGTVSLPYKTRFKMGRTRQLIQKFMPRSRVGIFRNEHTRSTPLDPKLMFWWVSNHLGAFGTVWLPYKTRCKTSRASAKVCATKSRRNFSQRSQPIHTIGPQTDILVCFILFGCIRDRFVALRNSVQNGPN